MPFTAAHLYVRVNGGFGPSVASPVDKWSVGLRIAKSAGDVQMASPALLTFANAVHAATITLHASPAVLAGTTCFFTHVTAARVGTEGKYDPAGQVTTVSTGSPQAGSGTLTMPWSACLSIGLRTAQPRGYASNGRLYYPMTAGALASGTGRATATVVTNRLAAFKTWLNAINTAANTYDAGAAVSVMSSVGAGATERVLSIRSDERVDNIERRENDLAVTYQTTTL